MIKFWLNQILKNSEILEEKENSHNSVLKLNLIIANNIPEYELFL